MSKPRGQRVSHRPCAVMSSRLPMATEQSGARPPGAQPYNTMGFQKEHMLALALLDLWLREAVTVDMANTLGVPPRHLTDHATIDRVTAEILPRVTLLLGL